MFGMSYAIRQSALSGIAYATNHSAMFGKLMPSMLTVDTFDMVNIGNIVGRLMAQALPDTADSTINHLVQLWNGSMGLVACCCCSTST